MSGGCPALQLDGPGGIASALQAVDCQSGQASAVVFGRLFGEHGALLPALTILLTLYVALFALQLITGRASLGVSALTPRMLTLGLALTFATSWAAYESTVWTLAVQAPDELATIAAGTQGSATTVFANRLDGLLSDLSDAAEASSKPAPPTQTGVTPAATQVGGFSATTVMWLSAMMLLLGTAGVIVASKIALAALLALGPVFIVLALFAGTRGLFEGWLKSVVMFAVAPLLAVLLGGAALAALDPVVADLALAGEQPSTRAVGALFTGAAVYLALMGMALKAASTLVNGWRLPGSRERARMSGGIAGAPALEIAGRPIAPASPAAPALQLLGADDRVRRVVAALPGSSAGGQSEPGGGSRGERVRVLHGSSVIEGAARPVPGDDRVRGVGAQFRARPAALRGQAAAR